MTSAVSLAIWQSKHNSQKHWSLRSPHCPSNITDSLSLIPESRSPRTFSNQFSTSEWKSSAQRRSLVFHLHFNPFPRLINPVPEARVAETASPWTHQFLQVLLRQFIIAIRGEYFHFSAPQHKILIEFRSWTWNARKTRPISVRKWNFRCFQADCDDFSKLSKICGLE